MGKKKNRGGEKVRIRKMRLPYSPEAIKSFFPEQGSGTGFPSILHELETGFSSLSEKYYILLPFFQKLHQHRKN
jgi:hypothetical protein